MSKQEIKEEINHVLDGFSDKVLGKLLSFLKEVDLKQHINPLSNILLDKILKGNKELSTKLVQ